MRSELRRDAVFHHGAAGVPEPRAGAAALDLGDVRGGGIPMVNVGSETAAQRDRRLEGQKDFLATRKVRHDTALEKFERAMDALAEDCEREGQGASEFVRKDLEANTTKCNQTLEPLEPPLPSKGSENSEGQDEFAKFEEMGEVPLDGTIDPTQAKALAAERAAHQALRALGERTESEVKGILVRLEAETKERKRRVLAFAGEDGELARIDDARKLRTEELLKVLVDELTAAAHVVHGEAERLVEQRASALNSVLLENRKAMRQLEAKLSVQTLELSKANKARWHKGLLLWKQQRHRHSMHVVMKRIRSNEFRQPDSLVEAVGRVGEHQAHVFRQRQDLVDELFSIPQRKLTVAAVRNLEEQNTQLNDKAQEAFDAFLVELKELREALEVSAEQMIGGLSLELELHDARQEWKGHESVANLIDADVRPPLRECLDQVAALLRAVADKLSRQEEALHHGVTRILAFFLSLAKKQEQLKKRVDEFEVQYNGEVEDCEKDFEETCDQNENRMKQLHDQIDDAAHHETLDELKQKTFDHLDSMALGYRGHADQLLSIHNRYPGEAADLIRKETRGYCEDLGLALDPVEEAEVFASERAAANAELEAQATADAEAAVGPAPETQDEAALAAHREQVATAVEAALAEVRQAAEAREADALAHEAEAAEPLAEISEWPDGAGTGCRVLERLELPNLAEVVLAPVTPGEGEGGEEGAEAEADGDGTGDEQMLEPHFADGTSALDTLSFENSWLEHHLASTRDSIFKNITSMRQYLDRVDIVGACEEVRRDLDQRLRRHTNRKGEVQVEWYVPRYGTVAKHKDKFERHLVDVARKCQDQDDSVDEVFQEVDNAETQFKQSLVDLRQRLGEAETLPVLTSFERQASDMSVALKESCKSALRRLLDLSSRAPQALQKDNRAFLTMCRSGDEQYSESEIIFYGGEIEELNATLDQRAQQRAQRARELEGQIEEKRKAPLAEFSEAYAVAVETLCASKGYGRKYGEPRRKAQERVRTLIAQASTVRSNMQMLLDYVQQILDLELPQDGGMDSSDLPISPPIMKLRHFFRTGGDSWTFTGEMLGMLYVVVCAMAGLGSHLDAFKDSQVPRYQLSAVPALRILREDEVFMPSAETQQEVSRRAQQDIAALEDADERAAAEIALKDQQSLQAETALREDGLLRVLGPLLKSEHFNVEIQSIVKASNEAYAGQAGGTPDFMQKFLSEMQLSSEHARQEASRGLRSWGDDLRETTLLRLGDTLFAELSSRAIAELLRATKDSQQKTVQRWADCDKLRALHEQRLNPGLANPNAEAELLALIEAEAQRHESALSTCRQDRESTATALRGAAESFVCRLTSVAEEAIRLVDMLPLHSHFRALPGDEKVEPARMSIKRRLRRLNAEAESGGPASPEAKDPKGKGKTPAAEPPKETPEEPGLPERTWPGLPRYELRAIVYGDGWPEDRVLAPAETAEPSEMQKPDPQKLQELTETLNSFRSPVHRSIVERRAFFYERYKKEFIAEVERRSAELVARETKEEAGERNWQSMVRQLRGEAEL
mmetsp:Transcript_61884/g.109955  ORF Transcript_61884/g.109955 Transcript_61884/m.109955 type:complete len:1538 (-) Transcript_61884:220-4833(-)